MLARCTPNPAYCMQAESGRGPSSVSSVGKVRSKQTLCATCRLNLADSGSLFRCWQSSSKEMLCATCRLNLAEGRFLSPLPAKSPGINACGISSVHGLFGCAGDDGVLECFDLRKRTSIGTLNAAAAAGAVSVCACVHGWSVCKCMAKLCTYA